MIVEKTREWLHEVRGQRIGKNVLGVVVMYYFLIWVVVTHIFIIMF